jgi:cobalt-zinc-cadmium resistance protein CzcA
VVGIKFSPLRFIRANKCIIVLLLLFPALNIKSQNNELAFNQALDIAIQNNKEIEAYRLGVKEKMTLIPSAVDLGKTDFYYGTDQNNLAENNYPLKIWGLSQSFSFPTLYSAQIKANKNEKIISETELEIQKEKLLKQVSFNYIKMQIVNEKLNIYRVIDSLYDSMAEGVKLKYETGQVRKIELLNIIAGQQQIKNQLNEIISERSITYSRLKHLLNYKEDFVIPHDIILVELNGKDVDSSSYYFYLKEKEKLAEINSRIEKNKLFPDFTVNYFLGTNFYENSDYYHGFEVGISVPIFYKSQKTVIKASKIALQSIQYFNEYEMDLLKVKQAELLQSHTNLKRLIENYNNSGVDLYDEIMKTSKVNYENGEIDFFNFASSIENALQIKIDYLNNLLNYTSTTLELNYLSK